MFASFPTLSRICSTGQRWNGAVGGWAWLKARETIFYIRLAGQHSQVKMPPFSRVSLSLDMSYSRVVVIRYLLPDKLFLTATSWVFAVAIFVDVINSKSRPKVVQSVEESAVFFLLSLFRSFAPFVCTSGGFETGCNKIDIRYLAGNE